MSTPAPRTARLAEARGAVGLAAAGADHLVARVHELHRAISDLPFRSLAPVPGVNLGSGATRVIHDGITDAVYGSVRGALKLAFSGAEFALRRSAAGPAALAPSPRRDAVISALAGFYGDDMAVRRNPLAPRMGFYHRGQPLPLTAAALSSALPAPPRRLAVFIHGLSCNEASWDLYTEPGDPERRPYPERLGDELGYLALRLRYNSGLHISRNGARLARLLARLVARYPGALDELVLVGHSMGGLVARAAVAAGMARQDAWVAMLSTVICLGSPHRGAPLEQWVYRGVRAMDRLPLTRPLARFLDARSVGVKDLGHGYVVDADWRGLRPDTPERGACTRIPRPPHARYHFIGASVGGSPDDRLGQVIGDGLVLLPSATAAELADADSAALFGTHHMRLLNHPVIWTLIRDALARR